MSGRGVASAVVWLQSVVKLNIWETKRNMYTCHLLKTTFQAVAYTDINVVLLQEVVSGRGVARAVVWLQSVAKLNEGKLRNSRYKLNFSIFSFSFFPPFPLYFALFLFISPQFSSFSLI